MSVTTYIPLVLKATTTEELQKLMMEAQIKQMAKLNFFNIYYDSNKKQHVAWYYTPKNLGSDLL